MRLIDADALYERACSLEAQAMDYVRKLTERDGDKVSVEWKIWSVALTERTAFKHDVFDAPTIEERKTGKWIHNPDPMAGEGYWNCSECGLNVYTCTDYCPNCGADMRDLHDQLQDAIDDGEITEAEAVREMDELAVGYAKYLEEKSKGE